MADVLSQSQIDALLKSMRNDEAIEPDSMESIIMPQKEKAYRTYDFYSPRKFTKEKIKILNSIFENYARILTSQVNGIFRVMTDITVFEVQERRYYEYVNAFHENDCMTLVDTIMLEKGRLNVPLMLHITPGLVITLINHMLGGADEIVRVEEDYRYSDVEFALYRRVAEYITGALKDGFSNYVNVKFEVQRVEENPTMAQEIGLDETVAIILLNVDVAGRATEKIRICMPGTLLEAIFQVIDTRKHLARGFSYEDNRETILANISCSLLPVTAQLGTVHLDLEDLYRLQPGDVIDLGKAKDSSVKVFIGRQPWFTGQMGRYKKNVAVRITSRYPEKTDDEEDEDDKTEE
ncbi:MAG: flagellar motor switch protein FliM [Clostridium sp.]